MRGPGLSDLVFLKESAVAHFLQQRPPHTRLTLRVRALGLLVLGFPGLKFRISSFRANPAGFRDQNQHLTTRIQLSCIILTEGFYARFPAVACLFCSQRLKGLGQRLGVQGLGFRTSRLGLLRILI